MPSWLADGKVDWNDIQGIPPGFADNVDNDRYRHTIPWTSITGIPPGFADEDDVGGSNGNVNWKDITRNAFRS